MAEGPVAELIELVAAPLRYPFVVRALVTASIVGVVCATVGSFVVLRGTAFLGDALSHAILPGVAVGYVLGGGARGPLVLGALAAAIVAALGIGAISRRGGLKEDTAIGIVFAGMFALGIAVISSQRGYAVDLSHILFGNVLGVSRGDLALTAAAGAGIVAVVVLLYKELVLVTFDPVQAATLRLPVARLQTLLLVLTAIAIVVSLQTVGVGLMVAMLVTPAATAFLLTRRLAAMIALGALLGALSAVAGIYVSYYADVASGAAIVLVCTAVFGVVFVAAPGRGWLWRKRGG